MAPKIESQSATLLSKLPPKAKAIFEILVASDRPLTRDEIIERAPLDIKLNRPDTTSYIGAVEIDATTDRPKHEYWDKVARDPQDKRWNHVSLLGHGLVEATKVVSPKSGQNVDAFIPTDYGRRTAKANTGTAPSLHQSSNPMDTEKPANRSACSLDDMYDYFSIKEFRFQPEVLTRYYLSLKTKPLVILTGISGTGKTKIAQLFARYICQSDSEDDQRKRIAFISVRPDWTDNRGLLGFYNLLDQKYHSTVLLDLLLHAQEHLDQPHFVILDEMNLAKVEYYFSDFLSVMESRTHDDPAGESIYLHEKDTAETSNGRNIAGSIQIPPNVFFTGTVNVDETTYMFSPKVLDRANVIEFSDVNIFDDDVPDADSDFLLKNANVQNELVNLLGFCSGKDLDEFTRQGPSPCGELRDLQRILQRHYMHFGYRVANEISRFANLAIDEVDDCHRSDVLDIQILQKILPKLHGTEAKLTEPLKEVLDFCVKNNFTRSARKIERMQQRLNRQGFASFIDA